MCIDVANQFEEQLPKIFLEDYLAFHGNSSETFYYFQPWFTIPHALNQNFPIRIVQGSLFNVIQVNIYQISAKNKMSNFLILKNKNRTLSF